MRKFAKLYETEDRGQILVTLDANDDGDPAVMFRVAPPGLGICAIGPSFKDTDAGWESAEKLFNSVDQDMAYKAVSQLFDMVEEFVGGDA